VLFRSLSLESENSRVNQQPTDKEAQHGGYKKAGNIEFNSAHSGTGKKPKKQNVAKENH
jgi:hypothetical protein